MNKKEERASEQNLAHVARIYQKGASLEEASYVMWVREKECHYYQKELQREVDEILENMVPELARIIENDFLYPKKKGWWENMYAPAVYQRMKNIAICAFFHCLYT